MVHRQVHAGESIEAWGGECEEEWEVSSGNELGEPWYVVGLVWFATECREHMG